jgi:lysophospholipase L1-like esterase
MDRVKRLLASDQPTKWLFLGDSITHGALHTFGYRDYAELFAERVRYELGRSLDVVINTAISGNSTRDLLAQFEWRVAQFKPQVVFVMIGMNDCGEGNDITLEEFCGNLAELVRRLEAVGALGVLQTTCPILAPLAPERAPHFPAYMDAVRSVAAQSRLPLVDHARFWAEHPDKHFYWMSDAFHPNAYGHRAFAELIFRRLGIHDPAAQSCRLHIP